MRNRSAEVVFNQYETKSRIYIRGAIGATAIGAALFLGQGVAQAQPTYNLPGTGNNDPGIGLQGERIPYPAATPGLQDMPGSIREGANNLNNAVESQPGSFDSQAFSQGAVAARQFDAEHPAAAGRMNEETFIGDPCNPKGGILLTSQDARNVAGMGCPPDVNPANHRVEIYDKEDPIATGFHPQNLVDAANQIAGYENRHTYNSDPASYDVSQHDEGNTTYVVLDHHTSALHDALAARGIQVDDNLIQSFLPH